MGKGSGKKSLPIRAIAAEAEKEAESHAGQRRTETQKATGRNTQWEKNRFGCQVGLDEC